MPSKECFYVIHSGKIRLSSKIDVIPGRKEIVLGAGNFFSVVSGLSLNEQLETVIAETDTILIMVSKDKFPQFLKEYPSNGFKIIQYLSQRVCFLSGIYTDISAPSTSIKLDLLEVADFYKEKRLFRAAYYIYNLFLNSSEPENIIGNGRKIAETMLKKLEKYGDNVRLRHSSNSLFRFYEKDSMIFSETENNNEIFFLTDGSVQITRLVKGPNGIVECELDVLSANDIFGEMALVENMPCSSNAITRADSDVFIIKADDFPALIKSDTNICVKIATSLCKRVYSIHEKIIANDTK